VPEGFPRDEPGPGGAIVDVDAADKFDRDSGERDAGQAQRRKSKAAIEEPGVEQAIEHESEDQEIPVRRGVAVACRTELMTPIIMKKIEP